MRIRIKTKEELLACGWQLINGCMIPGAECLGHQTFFIGDDASALLGTEHVVESTSGDMSINDIPWKRDEYWRLTTRVRIKTLEELLADGWSELPNGQSLLAPPELLTSTGMLAAQRANLGDVAEVMLGSRGRFDHGAFCWFPGEYVVLEAADNPSAPTEQLEPAPVPPSRDEAPQKPEIVAFREATFEQARELVTCGFELETQATDGLSWDDIGGGFDEDAYNDEVDSRVDSMLSEASDLMECLSSRLQDQVRQAVFESVSETVDRDDFTSNDCPENHFSLPRHVEVVQDTSVDGFEFRTVGARSYDEFVTAARAIFRKEHKIDTGCSFHVHLQVKGVQHVHGERFQKALTEFLVQHIADVPESVRERWAEVSDHQYFKPGVRTSKYSFVWRHEQGTWEFRCFGNVRNAEDGQRCLDLAVRAMQYAYRVRDGQVKLFSEQAGMVNPAWRGMIEVALTEGKSITDLLGKPNTAAA